jgi:hypothetical protein
MPLTAKGEKILHHMVEEYGAKKGKSVFYASANAHRISGVHHDADIYAETGETPGTPVNVSAGITPAMLNDKARALYAPETRDNAACLEGTDAGHGIKRIGQP